MRESNSGTVIWEGSKNNLARVGEIREPLVPLGIHLSTIMNCPLDSIPTESPTPLDIPPSFRASGGGNPKVVLVFLGKDSSPKGRGICM